MIEALLFDLGKVFIDFDFELGMRLFAARTSLSREEFERVIWDKGWIRRYERGEISTAEYHGHLCENGGLCMALEEFEQAWSAVFLPDLILPEQLLLDLKQRYPLILVSNTNEAHVAFISKQYPVLGHFGHRIFSHEVGSLKPDSRIYEEAIRVSGKAPESLFFTDDREENIEAALQLGIRAHLFRSPSGLLKALRDHGVEVADF
jgi:HAD superfamily hydrolase (TIGR01509 family)